MIQVFWNNVKSKDFGRTRTATSTASLRKAGWITLWCWESTCERVWRGWGCGASEASGLLPWNACSDAASLSPMGLSSFFRLHHEQPRFETSERRLWGHCFLNADATFRTNLPLFETVDLYNIPALRTLPNIKPTKLLPSILVVQLCIQFQFSLHPTPCFAFNFVLFCHLPTINQRQTFSWAYATGLTFGNICFTIFGSQIDAKQRAHILSIHISPCWTMLN